MRRHLRRFCLLTLALAVVGISPASAQTEMTMRLDWKAGAQHAPFYLGKQLGYYADEGIDLEIISGSGSSDVIKQVGSGAIELGLADALVLTQAAEQRVPVKSIAAYYQRTPIVLISPKANPITDPKQLLSGVLLGSKKGSATYQGLLALLAANGLEPEQIQLADIGFGVQPLLVKQVDAMMGFAMNEPLAAESAGMPVNIMAIADYGVDVYGLTIITNLDLIEQNGDLLRGFLRATVKAMKTAMSDPDLAVEALAKSVEEVDVDREAKVLERTVPYWKSEDTAEASLGAQTQAEWRSTVEVARELGLIESALAPADLFTTEFLDR